MIVSPGLRSLEAAGNRDYTVETIAGSNHLFQRCETGYPDEYFTIDHDIRWLDIPVDNTP